MVNNFEIEKKANYLIKRCGDALEEISLSENETQYQKAVAQYNKETTKLMGFYDCLDSLLETINKNTECFDREFDDIERRKKSQ